MLRVKDINASLDFYARILGFRLIDQRDFPEAQFSLYFLALLPQTVHISDNDTERRLWMSGIPGVLELTHNYGTETQEGQIYHNGNSEPRGFGHICISVPDLYSACARFGTTPSALSKTPNRWPYEKHRLHQRSRRLLGRNHLQHTAAIIATYSTTYRHHPPLTQKIAHSTPSLLTSHGHLIRCPLLIHQ